MMYRYDISTCSLRVPRYNLLNLMYDADIKKKWKQLAFHAKKQLNTGKFNLKFQFFIHHVHGVCFG